ncbi:hypothetical protein AAKU55_004839 [Oxalobacteraceae bacterium GrIS 1.11]
MALQRKGYCFEMIAKTLDQHGFAVTATTLKRYCLAGKPVSRRKDVKQRPAGNQAAQGPNSRGAANCAASALNAVNSFARFTSNTLIIS